MTPPPVHQVDERPPATGGLHPAILRIIEALAVADVERDYDAAQKAADGALS
ncbi:hypothetical protein [Caulobacter sp. RL271]|uniref:Uncharacterized protein n=1 Tax=Caulobacter segnis TaxID=88688 RepID=A0ABY4ZWT0_9CAUL|nr:hypothetical protein [Caulobacter segnis]USQ97292.1 hypothetical protein MZV50_07035 [Caulobacter segnis]